MLPTHYTGSKGTQPIERMNDYHLHNAIKKIALQAIQAPTDVMMLQALRAEQARRGGPPKDAKP
jgi:hypothetical protein